MLLIRRVFTATVLLGAFVYVLAQRGVFGTPTVLFEQPSPFGTVQVLEQPDGLRELYLTPGGSRQTALYPGRPLELVLDYTRVAQVGVALTPPDARMLFVGLGGGAMPMWARRVRPNARISAVDIDPVVVRVAQEWFGFDPDWGMRAYIADGAEFIAAVPDNRWHLIMLDAFSVDGVPEALSTRAFFEDVRRVLRPDGIVVGNVHTSNAAYAPMLEQYRAVFDQVVELQVPGRAQRIVVAAGAAGVAAVAGASPEAPGSPGSLGSGESFGSSGSPRSLGSGGLLEFGGAPRLDRETVLAAVRALAAERPLGFDLEREVERAWR